MLLLGKGVKILCRLQKPHPWACLPSPSVCIDCDFPYLCGQDVDMQIPRYLPGHLLSVGWQRVLSVGISVRSPQMTLKEEMAVALCDLPSPQHCWLYSISRLKRPIAMRESRVLQLTRGQVTEPEWLDTLSIVLHLYLPSSVYLCSAWTAHSGHALSIRWPLRCPSPYQSSPQAGPVG